MLVERWDRSIYLFILSLLPGTSGWLLLRLFDLTSAPKWGEG